MPVLKVFQNLLPVHEHLPVDTLSRGEFRDILLGPNLMRTSRRDIDSIPLKSNIATGRDKSLSKLQILIFRKILTHFAHQAMLPVVQSN